MELEQFGVYRIQALLGQGGMGEVYRAYDTEHDRVVALKVLSEQLAADQGYRERFRREAHLAARLNQPHIVPIHRYGEIDGRLFLDMRLVPGRDLQEVLEREGPMPPQRAVSIVNQVAHALDAAHADGLVHRDVKPSNILLTEEGEDDFVYLVDFGIARSLTDTTGPALTLTGAALGSLDYMAPERFLQQPIDERVDVYSLACVLFECLTAGKPFVGDGLPALMYAHLKLQAPAPSSLRPGVPSGLDDVVRKGLAKDPAQRWATAGGLAAAARRALAGTGSRPQVVVPQAPPTAIQPLPPGSRPIGAAPPAAGPGQPPTSPMRQSRPARRIPDPRSPAPGPPSSPGSRIDFSLPPPRLPSAPPLGPISRPQARSPADPQVPPPADPQARWPSGPRPVRTTDPPPVGGPRPVAPPSRPRPAWAEPPPPRSRGRVVLLAALLVLAAASAVLVLALGR